MKGGSQGWGARHPAKLAGAQPVTTTSWGSENRCLQQAVVAHSTNAVLSPLQSASTLRDAIKGCAGLETVSFPHLSEPSKIPYSFLAKDKQASAPSFLTAFSSQPLGSRVCLNVLTLGGFFQLPFSFGHEIVIFHLN